MPRTCNAHGCDTTALTQKKNNGATDPNVTRVEFYECEFGHEFKVVLEPLR